MKSYFYESDDFDDFEDFTPDQLDFLRELMIYESMKTKPVESMIKLIGTVTKTLPYAFDGKEADIDVVKRGGSAYVSVTGKGLNIKNPDVLSNIIRTSSNAEISCKTNGDIKISLGYHKVFELEDK